MSDRNSIFSSFVFFLLVIALSLQGCTSAKERSIKKWKKSKWAVVRVDKSEKPDWVVYTREIFGTDFLEFKIEGEVEASPKHCVSSFRKDIHDQAHDPNNKKYPTYEIVNESKDSLLTYVIHNEPFIFKDTEMSVLYHFIEDAGKETARIEWTENWDSALTPPPSRKLSRVETFRGDWSFSSTSANSSKAANSVRFNPKRMPMWLVKPMVVKFLVEGFEKTRETVAKEK